MPSLADAPWLIVAVVVAALAFDFTNGWNDAANSIATVVSTRVLTPLQAVGLAAVANVLGAFYSEAVAKTIGTDIVNANLMSMTAILAALLGGIAWNTAMTLLGLPISASHALIGGLMGAGIAHAGWDIVRVGGVKLVLSAMLLSPVLGGIFAYLLMKLIYVVAGNLTPHSVNRFFRWAQLGSVGYMSLTHGTNDAQKVMGVITMALVAGGYQSGFHVPVWVKISSALVMGAGTLVGGWGVIKTLGMRMLNLKPVHGFAAETGAALLLTLTAGHGIPVSTTHTITGAILGVGMATRMAGVRWSIASKIMYAWLFTLPGTAVISYLSYYLIGLIV